jgi:hypothetical protein
MKSDGAAGGGLPVFGLLICHAQANKPMSNCPTAVKGRGAAEESGPQRQPWDVELNNYRLP